MSEALTADVFFLVLLVGLSIPLGLYINKVMTGQKVFLSCVLSPVETSIYRLMGIRDEEEMSPKSYASMVVTCASKSPWSSRSSPVPSAAA